MDTIRRFLVERQALAKQRTFVYATLKARLLAATQSKTTSVSIVVIANAFSRARNELNPELSGENNAGDNVNSNERDDGWAGSSGGKETGSLVIVDHYLDGLEGCGLVRK